jgi:uncharacterized membrane protein
MIAFLWALKIEVVKEMKQLKVFLGRLRNPSVILSIASQVITILLLFNVNVDRDIIFGVITASCTILTLLGIMSNPSTETQGYTDDIYICEHCNKETVHVMVNGQLVCTECGTASTPPTQ